MESKPTPFKRGNVVKCKCGFWGEPDSHGAGKVAVIVGSYRDIFPYCSNNDRDTRIYQITFKEDGNTSAWWEHDFLELISEGGEYEIDECKKIREDIKKRNSDLNWIKERVLTDGNLGSTSIITLFDEIGISSRFEASGEFICLFSDWFKLCPMFEAIFKGDYDKTMEYVNRVKDTKYADNIIAFYNKMNPPN